MNEVKKEDPRVPVDPAIRIFRALAVVAFGIAIGYFVYVTTVTEGSKYPFKLGLDLAGGSHLVYKADTSDIAPGEVEDAMAVLRDVIERRTNTFGVSEPIVHVERGSTIAGDGEQRLVVELPGVTDINEAVREIGETPLLEFKLVNEEALAARQAIDAMNASNTNARVGNVTVNGESVGEPYSATGLTGRYLARAVLEFGSVNQGQMANEPIVQLQFNEEGAQLFEEITAANVGRTLAIFLDGEVVSAPRINEAIAGGTAIISGGFTPDEARELVRNLNFGALPVPIELATTQTIGASLGEEALNAGLIAGIVGFLILSVFMILWYRIPGLVAVVALVMYVVMMLALFKLIPVVLTAAGLAGFILSVGLAVDANILIAERIKEELALGKSVEDAVSEGFSRAWLAIRDSNIAHIIAGIILFWFGTALIKGFALVFSLGVVVSMFSAITISRSLLLAIPLDATKPVGRFLLRSGIKS